MIRRKKKESFKIFTGSLNRHVNMSYVWEKMKIIKNRENKREWDKLLDEDGKEGIRLEVNKVAPPWMEDAPLHLKQEYTNKTSDERYGLNEKFTRKELERALSACRSKSSPGRDEIEYDMLKRLPEAYKEELLFLLNEAFVHS